MSAWARPGAKCVCVGDLTHLGPTYGVLTPVVGLVYTVRTAEFRLGPNGGVGLLLVEVVNAPQYLTNGAVDEISFDICDFRPLTEQTQEQDVALFRQIIAQVPAGVDA